MTNSKLQLALIAPPALLGKVVVKGDMHLVLAHMVHQSKEYREFYKNEKKYKILDNGAFELHRPMATEQLLEAADMVSADEVVAPDVFDNGEKTYDATRSFLMKTKTLDPVFKKKEHKFKIMAVPHGRDFIDWLDCFRRFYEEPHIDVIGVGYLSCKVFSSIWPGTHLSILRSNLVKILAYQFPDKPIHLLGGGSNPIEILQYDGIKQVRSLDTCFPFLCGQHGIWFSDTTGAERPVNTRLDMSIATLSDHQLDAVAHNINIMRRWIDLGRVI